MKLKNEFITHEIDGSQILVDSNGAFKGFARSNKTAAFIINCLKANTTKEDIIRQVLDKYEAPEEAVSRDVDAVIEKLRLIGAIEE